MVSRSQRVCLLCEFPATESGVDVANFDAEKWAEWYRRTLDTEVISCSQARLYICQFCIWEARLAHESSRDEWSENEKGCDWWTGHDDDHFFREYFYKKPVIRPCKVVLEKISSDFDYLALEDIAVKDCPRSNAHLEAKTQACQKSNQVEKESDIKSADSKSTRIFQCSICSIIFHSKYYFLKHTKLIHKNEVRCKYYRCSTYFLTDGERLQHEQKFHLNSAINKMVRCIYCAALFTTSATLYFHIKTQHKEAIKCDYVKSCANYFHTDSEKNDHIFNEHTRGLALKMTPMKCIYCGKILKSKFHLKSHVDKFHRDVKIKCRVWGCVVYFLSKKESEQHLIHVHQHSESLKKLCCPKCSYKSKFKAKLKTHLQYFHLKKPNMKIVFKCLQCPKSFPAKLNLNMHVNSVHAERCTCQYCGKSLQKVSMTTHYLTGACKPCPI